MMISKSLRATQECGAMHGMLMFVGLACGLFLGMAVSTPSFNPFHAAVAIPMADLNTSSVEASSTGGPDKCWSEEAGRLLRDGGALRCATPPTTIRSPSELSSTENGIRRTYNSPIVIKEFRIMFCWIPKNSCTKYKQLFARIQGFDGWASGGVHWFPFTTTSNFTPVELTSFANDDSWLRIVLLRDPIERFLSGYLDKVVNGKCALFGIPCEYNKTIKDMQEFIANYPWRTNDHFAAQLHHCGLNQHRGIWNRVALYHRGQMDAISTKLLGGRGLDVLMQHGWGTNADQPMWSVQTRHATNTSGLLQELCADAALLTRMHELFQEDYEHFKLPPSNVCDNTDL